MLNSSLDYETRPVEEFSILARDGAALTKRSNSARANVTVHVLDEQEYVLHELVTVTLTLHPQ